MNAGLPTADDLANLPVRAIVAYAVRTTRRVSVGLRGVVPDDVLDDALSLIEAVTSTVRLGKLDKAAAIRAGARVLQAYTASSSDAKTEEMILIVLSFTGAAMAAENAIFAAEVRGDRMDRVRRVARWAERTVRRIPERIDAVPADLVREAAMQDYLILVRRFGDRGRGTFGEPIDCVDD